MLESRWSRLQLHEETEREDAFVQKDHVRQLHQMYLSSSFGGASNPVNADELSQLAQNHLICLEVDKFLAYTRQQIHEC